MECRYCYDEAYTLINKEAKITPQISNVVY